MTLPGMHAAPRRASRDEVSGASDKDGPVGTRDDAVETGPPEGGPQEGAVADDLARDAVSPADEGAPTEPTEPTEPAEPAEPTEPTEPTEPAEPADS